MEKPKFHLNPNEEIVKTIREGLKRTGGYCPCRLQHIPENICIRMMVETGLMFISGRTIILLMPSGHWRKVLEAIIMSETEQPENILIMQMEAQH